jgi:membrane fusion protein (multidrug efflux system)
MYDAEAPKKQMESIGAPAADDGQGKPKTELRTKLLAGVGGAVALGAIAFGAYWLAIGSHYVTTEDAYVDADSAQVTPLIGAPVRQVLVANTQTVRRGQVLVLLDDTDARIAVATAQAQLDQAQRHVRGYFAADDGLSAQVLARTAEIAKANAAMASARSELQRTAIDLQRRKALAASGAISGEELTQAQTANAAAQANVDAAKAGQALAAANRGAAEGSLSASAALTANATIDANPEVAAARARLDQARVDLTRTVMRAPIDGTIGQRAVQVGQRVAPGVPLMVVVPIQQAYVNANFKEVQLKRARIGQPVELTSDLYGGGVKYHGRVVGFAAGTGSAFSLIPAQNATGNWIKVVQRVPVRIALDANELRLHPLRLGLSMKASLNTSR